MCYMYVSMYVYAYIFVIAVMCCILIELFVEFRERLPSHLCIPSSASFASHRPFLLLPTSTEKKTCISSRLL